MQSVFLLEAHDTFRQSLAFILDREPDLEVVSEVGSLQEARNGAARWLPEVDVAIVGLLLPDGIGTELIGNLREAKPGLPVMVLTVLGERELHNWALKMGANEVITKDTSLEEILAGIRRLGRRNGAEPNPRDNGGR